MVIIMIIISNQSPNHGTVILILWIPWLYNRHNFGKESLRVLQYIENLFCEQMPLSCYTGCQHTAPADFHLMEGTDEDLTKENIGLTQTRQTCLTEGKNVLNKKNSTKQNQKNPKTQTQLECRKKNNWMLVKNIHSLWWKTLKIDIIKKRENSTIWFSEHIFNSYRHYIFLDFYIHLWEKTGFKFQTNDRNMVLCR